MEKKDIVSFSMSGAAVLISLATAVGTTIRDSEEGTRTLRVQLTSVLEKIADLGLENAKLFKAPENMMYVQNASAILNTQNALLLQQARYLADRMPELVSPPELNAIAVAYANTGNYPVAETFYKRAVERCENMYDRAMATRSYAAFVFQQRRREEGRELFTEAIKLVAGADNLARTTNGQTYQMWGFSEKAAGLAKEAQERFERAEQEYGGIDNEFQRDALLAALNAVKQYESGVSPMPRIVGPGPGVP